MATLNELKQDVFDYVRFSLGDQMVDVELDPQHYEQALKQALIKYRQRSSKAMEESYSFLKLQEDQQSYILPPEVMSVKQVFKRSIGSNSGSATNFEPFEAGYLNAYMLQSGRVGGLLTYELFAEYQELTAKMFGGFLNFKFNTVTKELYIMRRPRTSEETILLWTYNFRPDASLLSDYMSVPWLRDYTLAWCKLTLGEAREKFGTIAGPQGGTTLNGTALKAEGKEMLDKLDQDLLNYIDGSDPYSFVIG